MVAPIIHSNGKKMKCIYSNGGNRSWTVGNDSKAIITIKQCDLTPSDPTAEIAPLKSNLLITVSIKRNHKDTHQNVQ
jgi:hypothetical protein